MKVKNPFAWELPSTTVKLEISGTTYLFNGVYDGHRSLPSKLLKMMATNSEEKDYKSEKM